jgi:hypothetical protein
MFTTFKTPQDAFSAFTDTISSLPKTETEIKETLEKVKKVFETEAKNGADVFKTYQKIATGDATMKDITAANKKMQEMLVSTRFAFILAVPGSIFVLPQMIKFAKEYGVDLVPASVAAEFSI